VFYFLQQAGGGGGQDGITKSDLVTSLKVGGLSLCHPYKTPPNKALCLLLLASYFLLLLKRHSLQQFVLGCAESVCLHTIVRSILHSIAA
jgi:hypothetical protein